MPPYLGEIRMFGGNFAPQDWAFCQGQQIAIAQNDTLFNLIGTTYGGDGQETFNLPDLRGRVPIHQGQGPGISQSYIIGEMAGAESVTLTTQQLPVHTHTPLGQSHTGNQASPTNAVWAASSLNQFELSSDGPILQNMNAGSALSVAGGSQPHDNMMPYVAINFIISLSGVFPQQS